MAPAAEQGANGWGEFAYSGIPVTGASSSGGRSATASRGEEGAVGVGEEGKFVVVCAVGLRVPSEHAPVKRVGCS